MIDLHTHTDYSDGTDSPAALIQGAYRAGLRIVAVTDHDITDGLPEAQTAAAVLGHNFPDSPWYQDSYALLNKGGLQPKENEGSWISRAFRA